MNCKGCDICLTPILRPNEGPGSSLRFLPGVTIDELLGGGWEEKVG